MRGRMRSRKRNADFRPRRPEPARYAHQFARILGSRPDECPGGAVLRTSGSRIRGRRRATQRTAWSCVGPSAPCFGTMVWADFLGARDCHVTPMPLALGIASQTPITLPANSPCTILIRAGNVVRDDLTVDIPPLRRTPTARGRTGVDGRSAASGIQRRGTRLASRYATDRKRPPRWRRFACGRP